MINANTVLVKKLHGFLPGRFCTTKMISFVDDITYSMNLRKDVDAVYFDFAKAFDSVNHEIILKRLKHVYNINGLLLNFIEAYLQNITQRVVVGGAQSRILPVNSGVPQGCILGPLLLVLFINDIHELISEGTSIALYADDTKIWRRICSYTDCVILNKDIASLKQWADENRMKFYPSKCKVLELTLKHPNYYVLPFDRFSYEFGDNVLDYSLEEKDIGVIMSTKLNWNSQHNSIITKASRQLGLLKRICHFVNNQSQRRALYITLVRSLLEHCGEIWGPKAVVAHKSFEPIQKRAVKWILFESYCKYHESDYMNRFKQLDLLPIQFYFQLKKLKLFHKVRAGSTVISIPEYIVQHRSSHIECNCNKLSISTGIYQHSAHSPSIWQ